MCLAIFWKIVSLFLNKLEKTVVTKMSYELLTPSLNLSAICGKQTTQSKPKEQTENSES